MSDGVSITFVKSRNIVNLEHIFKSITYFSQKLHRLSMKTAFCYTGYGIYI